MGTTYAAITIGASEISMNVYEMISKKGIRQLDNVRYPVDIGSETYTTGKISYNTLNVICNVLLNFTKKLKEYGVTDYTAVATSAIREAENNLLVLDKIRLSTGLKVDVISNSEQRFLCYKAIAIKEKDFIEAIDTGTLILDVGAGSIQLSIYNNGVLNSTQNIKLGFLRIKEILSDIENTVSSYRSLLEEYISNDLNTYSNIYLKDANIKNLIIVSDNSYEINKIFKSMDSTFADKSAFYELYDKLIKMSKKQQCESFGLNSKNVSLALPTAMVIEKILELSKAERLWFPGVKINDGLAVDYAHKKMKVVPKHDFSLDTQAAAKEIARKYMCNQAHNENVEKMALTIFDNLNKYHGLGKRERELLQLSIILHSCGEFINLCESAINSYNIIMSTEIIGISHLEREMVASIVDYGTGNDLSRFSPEVQIKISKLTAIFRLANAMDKSHKQKINEVKVANKDNVLNIIAYTQKDISLERTFFEEQGKYFSTVYGIEPILIQKK